MAKQQDRGTKREDPETGKKFYDLNKDPVVSPYTGKTYPRSFFEQSAPTPRGRASAEPKEEAVEEVEVEETATTKTAGPEIVSLEEAEAEESGDDEDIPEIEDTEEAEEIGEDDADTFLEEDEDEDDKLDFNVKDDD